MSAQNLKPTIEPLLPSIRELTVIQSTLEDEADSEWVQLLTLRYPIVDSGDENGPRMTTSIFENQVVYKAVYPQ